MDPIRVLRVTQNAYFSLLTQTKKLLLVTFCDPTAETGVHFRTDGRRIEDGRRTDRGRTDGGWTEEGQIDVEVEIVI